MKRWVGVFAALTLAISLLFSAVYFRGVPDPSFGGRPVSQWVHDLLSTDYTVRNEAQTVLGTFGEPAVPQLRVLLQRRNGPWEKPLVRLNEAFPVFNYRALDANLCRARASEMLGLLRHKAAPAVPDLITALRYDQTAADSERALVRIGSYSVLPLERALRSRHPSVRHRASRLLREFTPARDSTRSALINATIDPLATVRKEAALSLGAIAHRSTAASDAIRRLGTDRDEQVRAAAYEALGQMGDSRSPVLAALTNGLRDPSVVVSFQAARALWALRQDPRQLVPVLTGILATGERWQAAYVLGEMGPSAAPAVPALAKLLAEERVPRPFRTPPSSAFALGKIGRSAIPQLSLLLAAPDARVRMNALMAFGFMGRDGRDAVPELIKLLQDNDSEVRHTAAITLASIGAEPNLIIASLSDCLLAEDIYMRSAAAAVLRDLAPERDWYVPAE